MNKLALIIGANGQDASYMAEFLVEKGYEVHGTIRRNSVPESQTTRIEHLRSKDLITLHYMDLTDPISVESIISSLKPDEIYHLAAQSHVQISFDLPKYTLDVNAGGTLSVLEAVRKFSPKSKIYHAATSEMFGNSISSDGFQREDTPFKPVSPYGCSKLYAHSLCHNYRNAYDMFICSGILFNHESPRRGINFVTNKVVLEAVKIKLGLSNELVLGNLNAYRDWGHAKDYCIDLDTKILTKQGYKYRHEINVGDVIINFNIKTNQWEEDIIEEIYDVEHSGEMYNFNGNGFKFRCSPNHRMFYQKKSKLSKNWGNSWLEISAKELYDKIKDIKIRTKYDYRFPGVTGINQKEYDINDNMLILIGYLVTEGCLSLSKKIGGGAQLSVSQSNKKYLQELILSIKNLNLGYNLNIREDGVHEFVFNSKSRDEILSYFESFDIHELPNFIYSLSKRQSTLLYETMMNCDGCWSMMSYVSKRLKLAKQFSDVANYSGYRTKLNKLKSGIYSITVFSHSKKSVHQYITDVNEESVNENIWCIKTKNNGTIITENEKGNFISGNCKGMWLMLQQETPKDYVLATGISHTVNELVDYVFNKLNLDKDKYVKSDKKFERAEELHFLKGDSTKARTELGWEIEYSFETMLDEMIEYWEEILTQKKKCYG
jgi:GDPmannose 4,6-dehydratase